MEVEQIDISTSQPDQNLQNDEEDQVKKKLKNVHGESKSPNPDPSNAKDIEINPEKFNGPIQKPKTANKAFGDISDFLLFFENRNPEMKEFVQEFREIEKLDPEFSIGTLNTMIVPKIDKCLNDMSQKIKARTKSVLKRKNKYAELFSSSFKTWEEFYKQVFYAYTINDFLYEKLNKYLRNENWIKLDDLLPYTYCLLKAFLWGPIGLTVQENFETLKGKSTDNKLVLYRRADFDDHSLNFYDVNKVRNFSWNGVTSTSLIESVTKKFQGDSSKRPILIIIEVDYENLQPENFSALYLAKFSAFPSEEEVALPPGSIFELLEINKEKSEVEMRLRLVTNARFLAHKGQFMHGMLQAIMRNEDELKIVCLKEKELSRAIKHCQGNQLIKDIEFCFCNFNERIVEVCKKVFPTIKNLIFLTLNIVVFEGSGRLDEMFESLEKVQIKKLQILGSLSEKRNIKNLIKGLRYVSSLEYFKLDFEEDCEENIALFQDFVKAACQYLSSECILDIDIGTRSLRGEVLEINDLLRIKDWNQLPERVSEIEFLTYHAQVEHLNPSSEITENFTGDRKIASMHILERLKLEDERNEITEIIESSRGMRKYCLEDVQSGTLLELLKSKFILADMVSIAGESQDVIQEEPQNQGEERAEQRESLISLYLSFAKNKILDEEISLLCLYGIQHLQFLKTLHIRFDRFQDISDKGIAILSCQGIKYLTSLTSLDLSFQKCWKITDEGLRSLCFEGIQHLRLLTSLHLTFGELDQITDEGLKSLGSEGLRHLPLLNSLHLDFLICHQITDHGIKSLGSEGIRYLSFLKSLRLNFQSSTEITEGELRSFVSEGIKHLEFLTSVYLNLRKYQPPRPLRFNIFEGLSSTPRGINDSEAFGYELRQHLPLVTSFYLECDYCDVIADGDFGIQSQRNKSQGAPHSSKIFPHFSSSHLQSSLNSNKNAAFVVYHVKPGFYFKKYPFKCQETISQLLKNQSLVESKNFSRIPDGNDAKQTQKSYHVKLHFNGESDPLDHDLSNQKDIEDSWQGVETLSLNFESRFSISDQKLQSYLKAAGYFKSIKKLNLIFNQCHSLDLLENLVNGAVESLESLKNINFISPFVLINEIEKENLIRASAPITLTLFSERIIKRRTHFRMSRRNEQAFSFQAKCQRRRLKTESQKDQMSVQRNLQKMNFSFFENLLESPNQRNSNKESVDDFHRSWETELKLTLNNENVFLSGFKSLSKLSLNFFGSFDMTNEELKTLSRRLSDLKTLEALNLSFYGCRRITDEGLSSLSSEGLKYLGQLTELYLDFGFCNSLTDKGVDYLSSDGIKHLGFLTKLALNFEWCPLITDMGLDNLSCQVIKNIRLLADLRLGFSNCSKITDSGLKWFTSSGIQNLKSLTTLSLDFSRCEKLSNQNILSLGCGVLPHLRSLIHLDLSFGSGSMRISDEEFQCFCRESIFPLKSLLSLRLNMLPDWGISDEGLECLCCEGLQRLEALISFELISHWNRVTEKGIKRIAFKGMSRLIELEYLQISLPGIPNVSSIYEAFDRILVYFGLQERENFEFP